MLSAKDNELLHSSQPLFHGWYLEDIIGEGSSGTVYKITDSSGNNCALKVISVAPEDGTNAFHLKEQDLDAKMKYLDEMTGEILTEVRVMQKLKHTAGIVHYQGYDVLEQADSSSRLILIKMDLLKPLNKVLRAREAEFSKEEVAALGIELLTSLSECRKQNIIHRDIKPSNIFVKENGQYLLGDFGSARLLEKTMMASHKGTLAYMAPEIVAGQAFNATVDIYSLGLMMYQMLNNRRLPFLDGDFKFSDIEASIEKRLSGAAFPYPENADDGLGNIICKMCAYLPKNRYASPEECLKDLENYLKHGKKRRMVKTKSKLPTIIFLSAALAAAAFAFLRKTGSSPDTGISSGNVNASGAIAWDEGWLYYSRDTLKEQGIRISGDGKQKETLCNYVMNDINITDEYVFFSSRHTFDSLSSAHITGLYRMDKDGSSLACLDGSGILNPVVYGKYVYYMRESESGNLLCKIPVKGGKAKILAKFNKSTTHFYPYKDKLYVYNPETMELSAANPLNGTTELVAYNAFNSFCIADGLLYLIGADLNKIYIYEIDSLPSDAIPANDSSAKAAVTFPYMVSEFNVSDGVIYAALWDDPGINGIWRASNDGSDLKQIYSGQAMNLQLAGQKLYFIDDAATYQMDLDGKRQKALEDMTIFYLD